VSRKYKVLVSDYMLLHSLPEETKKRYPDVVNQIDFIFPKSDEEHELVDVVEDVDIIMSARFPITHRVIEKGKKLFFIQQCSDGYDNVDIEAAKSKGIKVSNAGGAGAIPVSEHAIMMMLVLAKNSIQAYQGIKRGEWPIGKLVNKVCELHGKTLGIVGLGKIGAQTARLANCFGMKILYFDPYRNDNSELGFPASSVSLSELMSTSDFISIHCVLNNETKYLIGKTEMEMMKNTAYLVNTSRGEIVDEEALLHVLEQRRIAGAGLDVFGMHADSIKQDSKLLELDNVILTPHSAAVTAENLSRVFFKVSLGNVVDVVKGKQPQNIIN